MAPAVPARRSYPGGFRVYTPRRLVLVVDGQTIHLPDTRDGRTQACRLAVRFIREGRVVGIRVER